MQKVKITVYPCVYREHAVSHPSLRIYAGLSLCIQGTHLIEGSKKFLFRFIPVYTGNTNNVDRYKFQNPVYPCVYREHSKYI